MSRLTSSNSNSSERNNRGGIMGYVAGTMLLTFAGIGIGSIFESTRRSPINIFYGGDYNEDGITDMLLLQKNRRVIPMYGRQDSKIFVTASDMPEGNPPIDYKSIERKLNE